MDDRAKTESVIGMGQNMQSVSKNKPYATSESDNTHYICSYMETSLFSKYQILMTLSACWCLYLTTAS